jgi:mannose-1-phosphate guanylyltransferase
LPAARRVVDDAPVHHAVILAGGSGTRLWPASRRNRPKQLLATVTGATGGDHLLGRALRRARQVCGDRIVLVATRELADLLASAAPGVEVIAEPVGRNTALALGLAAVHLAHRDPDAVIGALPSDHHIADEPAMAQVIARGFEIATRHDVVCTIGIVPTRAETGYGWLELGAELEPGVSRVARFVEKPDRATAESFLVVGRHLWNAGMFFVRATRLIAEIHHHAPSLGGILDEIGAALVRGPDAAAEAAARLYPDAQSISIDHAVMEKVTDVVTIAADVGWNDVGSWAALRDVRGVDAADNTVDAPDAVIIGGAGNIAVSDVGVVAMVGVSDLVVVRSGDAVLVIPRDRAQDVRAIVDELARWGLERYL